MVLCSQCGYGLAPGENTCRRCGEVHTQEHIELSALPTPLVHSTPSRRRVGDSSTLERHPGDVEAQQIMVQPGTIEVSPTDALEQLTSAPKPPRKTVLRVSPFVFFLAPMLAFYLSAVLASYTLHLGVGEGTCPDSLRTFLWGAILAGYVFVLAFSAMLVGPKWDSLEGKWLCIVVYTVLLGILTGKGARQLLSDDNTNACISSSWYRTCWVITGFYCIFWLCLAVLVFYEVFRSCLFPSSDRVVILGVGAGLNQLKVPKGATNVLEVFKHKFPMPEVLKRTRKPQPGATRAAADSATIDARREAELELALMDDPTAKTALASPSQTDVRKDNFFGSSATEKRRGSQKDSALEEHDQTVIPSNSRPTSVMRVRSTNSVAPSPAESEDEGEEKRPSITTSSGGLGGGRSFTVQPKRSEEEEKENSRGSGDEDDPFQAKIAANKRAQEQRRRELAEITRATEVMAAQREQQQPPAATFDPASLPPLSTTNTGAPAGILRGPSTATNDRFKMVEFHHGARLEEVKQIEQEQSRGESSAGEEAPWGMGTPGQSPSQQQQQQRQFDQNRPPSQAPPKFLPPLEEYRGSPLVAQSPYSYAPLPPPSSMQQQEQPTAYPAGAQTPQNPAYSYTHIPAGSPYANASGSPQYASNYSAIPAGSPSSSMASPLPSSSTMLSVGPVYERGPRPPQQQSSQSPVMVRLDPNDPNRFSKLMQQRNAEQPQRVWPPPPPPPRQQGQAQQPPTNPARYNTIEDDLSF